MGLKRRYTHLSAEKRAMIMALAKEDFPNARIARRCGVSESTISRELSRHASKGSSLTERRRQYSAMEAQAKYLENRRRCNPVGKFDFDMARKVGVYLNRGWSPEQIVNTVLDRKISFNTVYRWLYTGLILFGDRTVLRHKGKKRTQRKNQKAKKYAAGKSIHTRPDIVTTREEFGHFEVDTVESGRNGNGCIFTIVERKTRRLYAYAASACNAENFLKVILSFAHHLPVGTIKSLTGDRGKEFARYAEIEQRLKVPFYFADPHSPWQKGSNENTNGLLREYYPKKTDFSKVTQRDLYWTAVFRINNRPRKVLGWKTAQDCFSREIRACARNLALGM